MARPIAVVDYHKGNLSSVERGLVDAGGEVLVTDDPALIRDASGVVLPGVGSFGDAMEFLRGSGEADAVLAASVFHFGTFSIREVKEYMAAQGIPVRLDF